MSTYGASAHVSSSGSTSKCKTLFMLGEDAGSCLRIISNDGNKYNRALMGYVLQSHVRALVVTDPVGRVMCRSLIRLVLRSDTLSPVNNYARPDGQNTGNFMTDRNSSRVLAPPGGFSSFSLG